MKRILVIGSLLGALGCGIRGAPHPPAQPETPPGLPPGDTANPHTRTTGRGPFNPSPAKDAGTPSYTPPPDAGPVGAPDAGSGAQVTP